MSLEENLTTNDPKVISLFGKQKLAVPSVSQIESAENELAFDEIMKRNREVQERLRKERLKANQAVLKSYRIKN